MPGDRNSGGMFDTLVTGAGVLGGLGLGAHGYQQYKKYSTPRPGAQQRLDRLHRRMDKLKNMATRGSGPEAAIATKKLARPTLQHDRLSRVMAGRANAAKWGKGLAIAGPALAGVMGARYLLGNRGEKNRRSR